MQATVAEVALAGAASADASATPPRFALTLGTHDSPLGGLAGLLVGMPDVHGSLGRFELRVAARGDRGSELMQSLDLSLNIERGDLSYGNGAGARPVRFTLQHLALALPAGQALRASADGTLLDTAFTASVHAGALTQLMQNSRAPLVLELRAGSARAEFKALLQPPSKDSGSQVDFALTAPHSGEIAGWLGLKPGADAPIDLSGSLRTRLDGWHLADGALRLGHSSLSVDLQRSLEAGQPLIALQLSGELIDVQELQTLLPEKPAPKDTAPGDTALDAKAPDAATSTGTDKATDKATAKTTAKSMPRAAPAAPPTAPAATKFIDIPILPESINLAQADIALHIARIADGSALNVRDLRFDGHIRDGMMSASPFSANVAGSDFRGKILLDLRTQQPHATLTLAADALDVGSLLQGLGVARHIDTGFERLRLRLDLHSSRLGELLAQSELAIEFDGGHLTVQDANTGAQLSIALDHGELASPPGAPVHLDLRGTLDKVPVTIEVQTAKAADLINSALALPFALTASTPGASLKLSGAIERPLSDKDLELALDLSGTRLDALNALAHASLPPWGPWSISGKFHMSRSGYEVPALVLQVGNSQLTGHGKFDTTLAPPRIDVDLSAPRIQIDDFRFGDWSPDGPKPAAAKPPATPTSQSVAELEKKAAQESDQVQQLLSPELLRRQNAFLTVSVDQVESGKDALGSGHLEAKLDGGHAVIGPVLINTPGGSATMRLGFKPGDQDVGVSLRASAKHFDYGILARRVDPKSEMRGILSLDVDVSARAQHLSELWRYGKGHVDFAVWPENLKSGLLDLWAVNVLMAILPAVDSSNASKVNCAIGRFVMNDGKLSEKTILIDTTRMRVTGKGGVNFAVEDIQLYVQPHAKTPQFLSFALPIEVAGGFDEFHVGVRAADVLETVAQLATSIIVVPLQTLFGKTTPADGHDVCAVDFK
jgi:hypothetical protein